MFPSLSLTSSPNSASVRVDKATSEFLLAPDWTLNMEICDAVNSDHWIAKEVVKQVKKRLQHKNPRVQLLSLTLLETMVKNCGDHIHFHIAERKVLDEMIKLVKKRGDMQVRDKVLVLLDHWQEAFGGPSGKHAFYYWAYDELRRSGVQFPRRASDSPPIVTPPATRPPVLQPLPGLGMPSNSSRRLDEAMASEVEGLSLSNIEAMKNVMELLADMLQAVNPSDRLAVKDEVIVDLVERCRTNQKKLIQMLTITTDEVLLAQGLELNDALQGILAKHDAIASGSPLPAHILKNETTADSNLEPYDMTTRKDSGNTLNANSSQSSQKTKAPVGDEEEEDDEFAQLARRHSKPSPLHGKSVSTGTSDDIASSSNSNGPTFSSSNTSETSLSNALVLADPPEPVRTSTSNTKDQDMVDLLSIVLSTSLTSEEPQQNPKSAPVQIYSGSNGQPAFNSYVAPWAQPQPQPQQESQFYSQPPSQPALQPQYQPQQPSYSNYTYGYPPPPWAATPGYPNGRFTPTTDQYGYSTSRETNHNASVANQDFRPHAFQAPVNSGSQQLHLNDQAAVNNPHSPVPATGFRSLQHSTSFQYPQSSVNQLGYSTSEINTMNGGLPLQRLGSLPPRGNNGAIPMNGEAVRTGAASPTLAATSTGQKPFVPSYRLFEDLNVFGNSEGKIRSGPYPSASGNSSQSMVGGRR